MCEKELDEFDLQEKFSFKRYIGYGSKYDMNILDVKLCCDCFDKLLDAVLPMFKINPLTEYEIIVSDDGNKLIGRRKEKQK
jgi:hypothetical protein